MDCNDNNFCPGQDYGAHSAYVPCSYLPLDFIDCDDLIDHQGNVTSLEQSGNLGCLKFGGQNSKGNSCTFLKKPESTNILLQMCTWVHDTAM